MGFEVVGGGMQANTETSCSSAGAGASTTMSICKILQQSTIDTVTRHCPGYDFLLTRSTKLIQVDGLVLHLNCLYLGNCGIGFRACAHIRGHNAYRIQDCSYDDCLSRCCADPKCKSFDFDLQNDRCAIQYNNRKDVGENWFIKGDCKKEAYTEIASK